jgi:hypothetical protein
MKGHKADQHHGDKTEQIGHPIQGDHGESLRERDFRKARQDHGAYDFAQARGQREIREKPDLRRAEHVAKAYRLRGANNIRPPLNPNGKAYPNGDLGQDKPAHMDLSDRLPCDAPIHIAKEEPHDKYAQTQSYKSLNFFLHEMRVRSVV